MLYKWGSVPVLEGTHFERKEKAYPVATWSATAVPGTCYGGPYTLTSLLSGCDKPGAWCSSLMTDRPEAFMNGTIKG